MGSHQIMVRRGRREWNPVTNVLSRVGTILALLLETTIQYSMRRTSDDIDVNLRTCLVLSTRECDFKYDRDVGTSVYKRTLCVATPYVLSQ